jgi:hypothetical protein
MAKSYLRPPHLLTATIGGSADTKQGLAKVEVAPLTVPLSDGTVKIMPNAAAMASS